MNFPFAPPSRPSRDPKNCSNCPITKTAKKTEETTFGGNGNRNPGGRESQRCFCPLPVVSPPRLTFYFPVALIAHPSMKIGHLLLILAASTFVLPAQTDTDEVVTSKNNQKLEDGPAERGKFSNAVWNLWQQGDFESLEQMGTAVWKKNLKFTDGTAKLSLFFKSIRRIGSGDAGYLAAEKQVKTWEKKYPDSVIAPIVEAEMLGRHGWFFRGGGYAETVTDEGSAKFSKYLAEAVAVLEKSKARCSGCPEWYEAMIDTGLGQGRMEKAELDRIFEEGVKLAPDYYYLYFTQAFYLLPRWYGGAGEWQAFAKAQAELHGAEIYPRIVWSLEKYYSGKLFSEGGVSWLKMKAGFEKMLADYPNSNWNLNNYCRFACLAGDRSTAKKLFDRIGENHHSRCWTEKEFIQRKAWANKSE